MVGEGEDGRVITCERLVLVLLTTVVIDEGGVCFWVHVRNWLVFRSRGLGDDEGVSGSCEGAGLMDEFGQGRDTFFGAQESGEEQMF